MLNPLSLSPEDVHFVVRRMEEVDGEEALVVETYVRGVTTFSWVTPDGRVLKEESPMGWTIREEPKELAQAIPASQGPTIDLLSTLAVPIDQPLPDPEGLQSLTLLIDGAGRKAITLERPWQTVLPPSALTAYGRPYPRGPWCIVWLRRVPGPKDTTLTPPASVARYQRPSLFIQSEDPRIQAKAHEIVGSITDPWKRSVALNRWVYATLTKRLTVGLPTAVDVLLSLSGDCHEHTVLFTGLARSLGIPTRTVAGLVYYQGKLYYHAWPEVWVGRWVPTDPTLGQLIADATHLALVEAENEELLGLAQFIGQLRLSVLDSKRAPKTEAGS